MKNGILLVIVSVLLLLLYSCESSRKYTLVELENNKCNHLEMLVVPQMSSEQLAKLIEELSVMDTTALLRVLQEDDLELNRANYSFFYLANCYAKNNDLEQFIKYHKIGADQYLNPLSMLKMAQIHYRGISSYGINVNRVISYTYLHRCLETVEEVIMDNRSHILSEKTKESSVYLLEQLKKDARNKQFDEEAVRSQLKETLPPMLANFKQMYQLMPAN